MLSSESATPTLVTKKLYNPIIMLGVGPDSASFRIYAQNSREFTLRFKLRSRDRLSINLRETRTGYTWPHLLIPLFIHRPPLLIHHQALPHPSMEQPPQGSFGKASTASRGQLEVGDVIGIETAMSLEDIADPESKTARM